MLEALTTEIEATTDLATLARRLMKDPADGRVKLFVIRQALAVRRRHAELFTRGDYRPVEVEGTRADHVLAFTRTGPGGPTLIVVPRLLAARGITEPVGDAYWEDTALVLPTEIHVPLRDVFTGAPIEPKGLADEHRLPVGTVLVEFPVALLEAA
jgi:(1->4)-alpha-D-glucan 1-alpha-D-glucosylmutase